MDYKLKRQLAFGLGFLAVVAVVTFTLVQQFEPAPSCTDGVLNQEEERVDCGGPNCQACAGAELEEPQILWFRLFFAGGAYDAVAQIRNTNSGHGTRGLSYTFSFLDKDGAVVAERKGTTYLLAGQTRYLVESGVQIEAPVASLVVEAERVGLWEIQGPRSLGAVALPVFSKKFTGASAAAGGSFARVEGIVENQTSFSFARADIHIVLIDAAKNPVAAGKTRLDDVASGASRPFTALFAPETASPAEIYAEAITDTLDPVNVR